MTVAGFPTFRVHIGFPSDPTEHVFIIGVSLLGSDDVLATDTDGFEDVTDRLDGDMLEPIHIVRGRTSPRTDYSPGRATLSFRNDDGRFDPLNLEGPYVLDGVTLVECGRRVRITVTDADGVIEERFVGQVEAYLPEIDDRGWPTMKIECSDAFAYASRYDPEASSPAGEGELSGARQHRILDMVNVADGDRNIDAGIVALQATTLAQNALTEARLTAATESPLGGFYVNRQGRFEHNQRRAPYETARMSSPRATFGPPGVENHDAGILPYVSLKPVKDKALLLNDALVASVGGEGQSAQDETSIGTFFAYTDKRTDLIHQTDEESAAYAEALVLLFSDTNYRYDSVEIDALAVPDDQVSTIAAFMATSEIRDRIAVLEQVTYRDENDDEFVRENLAEVFIEQVEEWIGAQSWRQKFQLWSAAAFEDLFVIGVSLLGGDDRLATF